MIWWMLGAVLFVMALLVGVCMWVSYKIAKCLDRFDEFNFDEE